MKLAGIANLKGKTVIDTTNPIADATPVNGVLQYFTSQNESLMERLQALGARVLGVDVCFEIVLVERFAKHPSGKFQPYLPLGKGPTSA